MGNSGKELSEKWWENTMGDFTRYELNNIIDHLWHEVLGKNSEIIDLKEKLKNRRLAN